MSKAQGYEVSRRRATLNKYLEEENITIDQLREYVLEGLEAIGDKEDLLYLRTWLVENRTFIKIKKTSLTIVLDDMVEEGILARDAHKKGRQSRWYRKPGEELL